MLLPELVDEAATIIVPLVLLESSTSKKLGEATDDGLIDHWVPEVDDLRERRLLVAPLRVRVPLTVWVVEAGKVRVSAVAVCLVRLLNVVVPVIAWEEPSRVTVPELWVKVPAVWLKSPASVRVDGLTKVPFV